MSPDAAVDPTPRPGDFDTYWSAVLKELGELPAAVAAEKITAGAAQAFFQYGAGHAGFLAGQQACGMELHHFHVP